MLASLQRLFEQPILDQQLATVDSHSKWRCKPMWQDFSSPYRVRLEASQRLKEIRASRNPGALDCFNKCFHSSSWAAAPAIKGAGRKHLLNSKQLRHPASKPPVTNRPWEERKVQEAIKCQSTCCITQPHSSTEPSPCYSHK